MAGHSRWAKVKHFKGAIDAKRGISGDGMKLAKAAKATQGNQISFYCAGFASFARQFPKTL